VRAWRRGVDEKMGICIYFFLMHTEAVSWEWESRYESIVETIGKVQLSVLERIYSMCQ